MQTIVAQLLERFIETALLTVAVLFALMFALQRGRTVATLRGIAATIGTVVRGPVHFVRDVLDELAHRSTTGLPGGRGDPRMLIKRFLFATQLAIVIIALAVVSAGLAKGWDAMVPSTAVVNAYHAAVREKLALDSTIPVRRASIARLDSVWRRDSANWVQAYADTLKARIDRNDKARAAIRQQILTRPTGVRQQFNNAFSELDSYRPGFPDAELRASYERRVAQLFASLKGLDAATLKGLGFESGDSSVFEEYGTRWSDQRVAERLLARWGTSDVRAELQREYGPQFREMEVFVRRQAELAIEVPQLRAQRQWRPLNFASATFGALVTAFFLVWTWGLLLEFLKLAIDIAVGASGYLRRAHSRVDSAARDVDEDAVNAP
jgi:hypothetical protein